MSRTPQKTRRMAPLAIFAVVLAGLPCEALAEQGPQWWTDRGVLNTNALPADYAPAVLGQLKCFATNAFDELEEYLPGGAGTAVSNLVAGFQNVSNFCVVQVGQLKYVAEPFWTRLIEEGYTNSPPWTTNTTADDVDCALANIGQLKTVFNFDGLRDTDEDGLPDWWEMKWFGDLDETGSGDPDGDNLTNSEEYALGTNPTSEDTDGDAFSDDVEVAAGTDPLSPGPTVTVAEPSDNLRLW